MHSNDSVFLSTLKRVPGGNSSTSMAHPKSISPRRQNLSSLPLKHTKFYKKNGTKID
jgi:hypothetical protein